MPAMSLPGRAINVRLAPQDLAALRKLAQPRVRVDGKRVPESISEVVRRLIQAAAETVKARST